MIPPREHAGGYPFTLIWQPAAVAGLIRLLAADPAAAKDIRATIAALAQDPVPKVSKPLGHAGVRRLHLGTIRVLYQVDEPNAAVHILVGGQA